MYRQVLLLLISLVMCCSAWSQTPFVCDNWEVEDGLPNNGVSDVFQDRDGYIWVCGNGGLAKFDGLKFTSYDIARAPTLKSNRIIALTEDDQKRLWIGSEAGNLSYHHAGRIYAYDLGNLLHNRETSIRKMQFIPGKGVFVSTSSTGLFWIDKHDSLRVLTINDGLYSNTVRSVVLFHDTLWICDSKGTSILVNNRIQPSPLQLLHPDIQSFDDMETDGTNGRLVLAVGTTKEKNRRLIEFKNGAVREVPLHCITKNGREENPEAIPWKLKKDNKGNLYLLTFPGVVNLRFSGHEFTDYFNGPGSTTTSRIVSFIQDREGNYWAATEKKGLFRLKPNPFSFLDFSEDVSGNSVHSLCKDENNNLWWTSHQGTLTRYTKGKIFREAPPGVTNLWTVYHHKDTMFFGGSAGGLYWKAHGICTEEYINGGTQWIRAITRHHDTLYIGTYNDLLIRVSEKIVRFPNIDSLNEPRINRFFKDSRDRLWVLSDQDVFWVERQRLNSLSEQLNTNITHTRSALQLTDSLFLFGSYGNGILLYNGKIVKTLNTTNGLFDNTVSDMLRIQHHVWLAGDKGLTKLLYEDIIDFAMGRSSFVHTTLYDKTDGLVVSEFNGGTQSTCVNLRDNQYGFASINGIAIVDFDRMPYNSVIPPVAIETLTTDGKPVDLTWPAVELPYEKNNLEITYTALSLTSPKNNQFRYRLAGYDKEWRNAGTERKAVYTHLPPGDYTFTVIARNNDGVWNLKGKSIHIRIIPPFYLTIWFRIVLFLTIVSAIGGLIWLMISNIHKKEKANLILEREKQQTRLQAVLETEEAERKRIAEDLHDGIGPLLSTVKLNLALAEKETPANELISSSQQQIDTIATELRNITYNLVPTTLGTFGLVVAIREFIEKLQADTPISFYFENIGVPSLAKSSEVILFRVIQEVINNSIKHSRCSEITTQLIQDGPVFRIMIEDNGKGFDMPVAFNKLQSRGLKNIFDRCKVIGAKVNLDSQLQRGTSVTIEINHYES